MTKNYTSTGGLDSITDIHRVLGLPAPLHPLVTLIDNTANQINTTNFPRYEVLRFYKIGCITKLTGRFRYGQAYYDFTEGSMLFTAPNQVVGSDTDYENIAGYVLFIHPDFLQGYPLLNKLKKYGYFSYSSNEALHLSEQEKTTILAVFTIIEQELNSRTDGFSQDVLVAQIELLLTYAERFYKRQFNTRKVATTELLQRFEDILNSFFGEETMLIQGVLTVGSIAEKLTLSPRYLSDLLRARTGKNTQQHIHEKLIEKAKEKLSTTTLSVSEVAYQLGFEHSQSFSKLFKLKTNLSPLEFRRSFNVMRWGIEFD
jgi:AraC family transcriptional activator of pobA